MPRASLADYEIRPLARADLADVAAFSCGDADLDDFVRTDALRLQGERMVATYVARASRAGNITVVGYVSILVDAIVLQGPQRKKTEGGGWARMWSEGIGDLIRRRGQSLLDNETAITAALLAS